MAITYVGKGTATSSTGSISLSVPSGYAQDDLLLAVVQSQGDTVSIPSGWTEIEPSQAVHESYWEPGFYNGDYTALTVFYKIAGSSESSLSVADSGDHTSGCMFAFRGVNTSTPVHTKANSTKGTHSNSLGWPNITTTVDGCMVVFCGTDDWDYAWSSGDIANASCASLASLTKDLTQGWSSGTGGSILVYHGIDTTAGSVTGMTANWSSSGDKTIECYQTIALLPVGGATLTAAADITTTSTAESSGLVTKLAGSAVTTTSTATAAAYLKMVGAGALTTTSTATAAGIVTKLAATSLTTTSTATAAGIVTKLALSAETTTSTVSGSAAVITAPVGAAANITTTSTSEASATVIKLASGAETTTIATSAVALLARYAQAAATAISTAHASGTVIKASALAEITTSTAQAAALVTKLTSSTVSTLSAGEAIGLITRLAATAVTTSSSVTAAGIVTKLAGSAVTTTSTARATPNGLVAIAASVQTISVITAAALVIIPPDRQIAVSLSSQLCRPGMTAQRIHPAMQAARPRVSASAPQPHGRISP